MTKWKYEVESLAITQLTGGVDYSIILEKILNRRGKAGWELVSLAGPRHDVDSVAVFKRPWSSEQVDVSVESQ